MPMHVFHICSHDMSAGHKPPLGAGPAHDPASSSSGEPPDAAEDKSEAAVVDRGIPSQQPAGQPSLAEARQLLDEEHYGLDKGGTAFVVPQCFAGHPAPGRTHLDTC